MDGLVYRAAKQSDTDPSAYVLSDETVDRYGEVIEAAGWDLAEFRADRNPIALFNHNRDAIIGRWENVRVENRRLVGRLVLAEEGTSATVDEVRKHWRQGNLRAVSVGFQPIEKEPIDDKADKYFGPFRYLRQQLVECSLVSVPANPNALQISRAFELPADVRRQLFGKLAKQEMTTRSALPGKLAQPLPLGTKSMKSPILTKQIENAQTDLNRLRDQLNSLISVEERDDEQQTLLEQLPGVIQGANKNLELLQAAEKALGIRAAEAVEDLGDPANGVSDRRPFAMPRKHIEASDYVFRAAAISLRSFTTKTPLEQVIREAYGSDECTQIVTRAAVSPANTTTTGYAAELVQVGFGAFLDRLIADSIYSPLSMAGTRYDLGRNGTIKVPYRANTPQASGAWVAEGAPKPVKRIGVATVTLTPHKLSVITTFTEEMANSSVPAIEGILRKAMADDTQASLDGYLIDAVAESLTTRPAGLLNGVTPITASVLTTSIEKIVADISALIAPMEAAGGGGKVVLIMNPAQARKIGMAMTTTGDFAFGSAQDAASKLGAQRIITSVTVPAGRVIAVDADWFASATGDMPRFAVSTDATIHEEDTTPLALGTTGSPNVVAAPMRSLFQTDSIAIRLSLYVTWMMVRPAMVQTIAAVGW